MESYCDVIDAWKNETGKPDREAFAKDLGIELALAHVWYHRHSIPSTHWALTIAKAAERGIEGVTLDLLSALLKTKPSKGGKRSESTEVAA